MKTFSCSGWLLGLALAVSAAQAQSEDNFLNFELNSLTQVENGCRATFIVVNSLGVKLERTAIEIGVFDEKNVFSQMVVFDLGRLPQGKTKVVQYDLPRSCATISRLLLNSVKECAGSGDITAQCEDRIRTRNSTAIEFGQ
ncbi:MAG: hypothetical protein ACT4SY_06365 [Hyphomicrobiales bacterium]